MTWCWSFYDQLKSTNKCPTSNLGHPFYYVGARLLSKVFGFACLIIQWSQGFSSGRLKVGSIGWDWSRGSLQVDFVQVWTDLCNRKWPYGTENNLMRVSTDLCNRKCSYATGNDFMRDWADLCNRICSFAAGNNFMRVWTYLCNRKCSYIAENDFMPVWTNLCNSECLWVTNCWQELNFEFSRQN